MSDEDNLVIKAEAERISTFPRVCRSPFPAARDLPLCTGCLKSRCKRGATSFIAYWSMGSESSSFGWWLEQTHGWVSKTHVLYSDITWLCISNPLAAEWKLRFAILGEESFRDKLLPAPLHHSFSYVVGDYIPFNLLITNFLKFKLFHIFDT